MYVMYVCRYLHVCVCVCVYVHICMWEWAAGVALDVTPFMIERKL
jgi:hypothetical protein